MSNAPTSRPLSLLTVLLLAIACLVAAPSAQATVICTGNHTANWDPGVTNTTQTHTVSTETDWSCAGVGTLPILVGATSVEQFTAPFSCQSLLSPAPAIWTIHWSDGGSSTYSFTATVNAISGNLVIVATGNITQGRYVGRSAVAQFNLLNLGATLNAACASTGVTDGGGPSTFVIL
ncbi:hypothetical protein [Stenotrophomonas rhizophila]|uniref:hypothetical protein n=1 Tax=Stenotrophomonas rhizophila TaxID=216778 RepID=UPI001E30AD8A|nr:hypothetical protein [Stenotrophomonas rhizophila]MCC7633538.1 hypothetical protein [Stenotrophomonas rhizophila]MCC7662977.1 hypothetical protein [Stenotrophomonas rhizophila]